MSDGLNTVSRLCYRCYILMLLLNIVSSKPTLPLLMKIIDNILL